jgi:hypothetical protein
MSTTSLLNYDNLLDLVETCVLLLLPCDCQGAATLVMHHETGLYHKEVRELEMHWQQDFLY